MTFVRRAAAGLLAATLLAAPSFAQGIDSTTAFLQSFQGTWVGTGQSRTDLGSPYVPAECSIVLEWRRGGLGSDGNCSGARQTFSAGGVMMPTAGGVEGEFMAPYFVDAIETRAAIEGGALVVYSTYDAGDGVIVNAKVTVTQPRNVGGEMVMIMSTQVRLNGAFEDVASVRMVAQ